MTYNSIAYNTCTKTIYQNKLNGKKLQKKRKEKKKEIKRIIFSPGWLYQPGLEVPVFGVVLEAL